MPLPATSAPTDPQALLRVTPLLDFHHPAITALVAREGWTALDPEARAAAIYRHVRDRIAFGYNAADAIPASRVLAEGIGQCNTKTVLLMALLRACGLPCRLHAGSVCKRLQKGLVNGLWYRLAPASVTHTWTEVWVGGRWIGLEGVILDRAYLDGLRCALRSPDDVLLGFAAGTDRLGDPPVEWTGRDTEIQRTGLDSDRGRFDSPDDFHAVTPPMLTGARAWLYAHFVRHLMNRNVRRIRDEHRLPDGAAA